jgi:hypothetical protein
MSPHEHSLRARGYVKPSDHLIAQAGADIARCILLSGKIEIKMKLVVA